MLKKGWEFKMLKLDYTYSSIKVNNLKKYEKKINDIVLNFKSKNCAGSDFLGWYEYPSSIQEDDFSKLEKCAKKIRKQSSVFVVCGIGGSYLGTRAVVDAIKGFYKKDIEIIYLGNTFDERYTCDVLDYLKDKDFSVNVISKSGTTLETAISFRLLKELLIRQIFYIISQIISHCQCNFGGFGFDHNTDQRFRTGGTQQNTAFTVKHFLFFPSQSPQCFIGHDAFLHTRGVVNSNID